MNKIEEQQDLNKTEIIKKITFFPTGSGMIEFNRKIKTREDDERYRKELNEKWLK